MIPVFGPGWVANWSAPRGLGEDCGFPGKRCVNLPYSYQHQTVVAEVGYRVLAQTKLTLNETFETTYRNYADASFVTSDRVTAKVRSQLSDEVYGSVSFSHEDRNGHNYVNGTTWRLLTGGGVNPNPAGFLTFFDASRRHDEAKATLGYAPLQSVNTTFMAKIAHDAYPDSTLGLRNNMNFSIGPDVSWDVAPHTRVPSAFISG